MPLSNHKSKRSNALALKQAANWQCQGCGRRCRRHDESLEAFATRSGQALDEVTAHPRRWTLHLTQLVALPEQDSPGKAAGTSAVVLCGTCHRAYYNCRRRQHRQQQHRQRQEQLGQLTLNDIRLPLTGLQLSLNDWGTPYEIINPLPSRKRKKSL